MNGGTSTSSSGSSVTGTARLGSPPELDPWLDSPLAGIPGRVLLWLTGADGAGYAEFCEPYPEELPLPVEPLVVPVP
jgi:hypothetical protein